MDFETYVETNYSLASDVAKRRTRFLYLQLRNQTDFTAADFPSLIDRYENALKDLADSHADRLNEIYEMAWTIERDRRLVVR